MKRVVYLLTFLMLVTLCGCGQQKGNGFAGGRLEEAYAAVKQEYGESYLPSLRYDEQQIEEQFDIPKDLYKEAIAEGPMISAQVDQFLGFEAKEGKEAELEEKLKAHQDRLKGDAMQYPANQLKIEGSRVVRADQYVFFLMLGELSPEQEENDDEGSVVEAYREQNDRGEKTIFTALNG